MQDAQLPTECSEDPKLQKHGSNLILDSKIDKSAMQCAGSQSDDMLRSPTTLVFPCRNLTL